MEEIMTFSRAHASPRMREDKQEDKPTDRKVEQPRRPDKPRLVFPLRVFRSGQRVQKGRRRRKRRMKNLFCSLEAKTVRMLAKNSQRWDAKAHHDDFYNQER